MTPKGCRLEFRDLVMDTPYHKWASLNLGCPGRYELLYSIILCIYIYRDNMTFSVENCIYSHGSIILPVTVDDDGLVAGLSLKR